MKIRRTRAAALVAVAAIAAAACSTPPEETTDPEPPVDVAEPGDDEPDDTPPAEPVDYTACMVTDEGGVDDQSFNQSAHEGLQRASASHGIEVKVLESTGQADFAPNLATFANPDEGCDMIVTVGFLLAQATQEAAQTNPDIQFAAVDIAYDEEMPNVRELLFSTDEAAFLAGYVAAAQSESGVVGTYGGVQIPPVTIFMDGFLAGVLHHNATNGTDVQVLGWDGTEGSFTGNFESADDGRRITEGMLADGADIIHPVAGPVGLGSAAALEDAGTGALIWVDSDGYESTEYGDLMLTSVLKNAGAALEITVADALADAFTGGKFFGTLENGGVGLAPFHDFDADVSDELRAKLTDLEAQIVAGSLSVNPADYS